MDDLAEQLQVLREQMTSFEEWRAEVAAELRRSTEALQQAAGRLDSADRRYRQLQDRYEELAERHDALKRDHDRQAMKISVAGGVFIGDLAS